MLAFVGMPPARRLLATPSLPRLVRLFVLRLGADFGFRANHLAEPMAVLLVQAFVLAGHALVAGGHHLPCVLLPGVERLLFFLGRQIRVVRDVVRRLVVICRLLELGLLLRMRAHVCTSLHAHETTNLQGESFIAGLSRIACRIVPMWARRARDFAHADDSRHAPLPTLCRAVQARVPSGRQAVTFFMFIGNRSALARDATRGGETTQMRQLCSETGGAHGPWLTRCSVRSGCEPRSRGAHASLYRGGRKRPPGSHQERGGHAALPA